MSIHGWLLAYAVAVGAVLPHILSTATWPARCPRVAMALWIAAGTGTLGAFALAVLLWANRGHHPLSELLGLCAHAVRSAAERPLVTAAVIATIAGIARGANAARAVARRTRAARRRHVALLDLVGRPHGPGVTAVDDSRPHVYCVPGGVFRRNGRVVVTTGALALLDRAELDAAVAHERAHLHGRHGMVLAMGEVSAAAGMSPRGSRRARSSLQRLAEIAADDAARREHRPAVIASALRAVSAATSARESPSIAGRLRRLSRSDSAPVLAPAVAFAAVIVITAPFALSLAPALNPTAHGLCPF